MWLATYRGSSIKDSVYQTKKAKCTNEFDAPLETNVTDLMRYELDVNATDPLFSEDDFLVEDNDEDKTEDVPESHSNVPPNNTNRADTNHESPPIFQHKINTPELPTPSRKVFTPEQNKLFIH